jgi:flagellin
MREVAVQAANDTNNDQDRANLQAEMNALMAEIDRIAGTTTWAGENLMAADGGTDFSFQVGANTSSENQIKVTLDGMSSKALGLEIDENGSAQATLDVAISSTTTGGGVTTADATIVDGKLTPTAGVNSMTLTLGVGAGTPVEITGLAGDQSTSDAAIIATAINAGTKGCSSGT